MNNCQASKTSQTDSYRLISLSVRRRLREKKNGAIVFVKKWWNCGHLARMIPLTKNNSKSSDNDDSRNSNSTIINKKKVILR